MKRGHVAIIVTEEVHSTITCLEADHQAPLNVWMNCVA